MGDENAIPLNNELLTVAKIMDIESISSNYNLRAICELLESTNVDSLLKNKNTIIESLVATITFFSDTELVTSTFKEAGASTLTILKGYMDGLVLTDADIATLKNTLSVIYTELVTYGSNTIGLHKSIVFSLVDGELEKALISINAYTYATIAKLNSLLFKNVNSLVQIDKVMSSQVKLINRKLAGLDVMIDMSKASKSYSRGELVNYIKDIQSDLRSIVNNIFDSKYIVVDAGSDRYSKNDDVDTTATNDVILSAINNSRESIKACYGTLRINLLETSFNLSMSDVDTTNYDSTLLLEAIFKETIFKLKADIDILTEIVCSITDAINNSIEKLKLSIPSGIEEIDNIDIL